MHEPTSKPCLELLREYAHAGSETAFEEVVRRYLDFVHSVALRRVDGDTHQAKDVAQRVFLDLAQQLRAHPRLLDAESLSLGGWLHRHTCFVTANLRRSEARRRQREQRAFAMNAAAHESPSPTALWQDLAPELDEAVQQLSPADRDTLILRYYEQQNLKTVGAALGISDDAAQKRVQRALDRLRDLLVQQGLTLSLATLALLLEEKTVAVTPASVASAVVQQVLSARPPALPPSTPPAAPLLGGLGAKLALATLGTAMLAALVFLVPRLGAPSTHQSAGFNRGPETAPASAPVAQNAGVHLDSAAPKAAATPSNPSTPLAATPSRPLLLSLLDAQTGQPVPRVPVEYRRWEGEHFSRQRLVANTNGDCLVPVVEGTTRLELTTRLDGYADTRILWEPGNGATLPETFSVRLEKPVPIGGTVVNPDGQPVVGAKVGFNHEESGSAREGPVSQRFAWVETQTDAAGRWRIDRIGASVLPLIYGSAQHPEFESSPFTAVSSEPGSLATLTNLTHVFQLRPGGTVAGKVVDSQGHAVAGATVSLGGFGESGRREEKSLADGTFILRGGPAPPTLLTAVDEGFAPTTVSVTPESVRDPFTLVLAPGKPLRLRVVDSQGQPIVGAHVWLDTMANSMRGKPEWLRAPPVQFDFNPRSDAEGRAVWDEAPDRELTFDVYKPGYQRLIQAKVHPGKEENVLTLKPALVLHGRVTDQETGQPIARFRTTLGSPHPASGIPGESIRYFWGTQERQRVQFEGGEYRHSIEEPVLWGTPKTSYVLRIEADDYAPTVTRVVEPDEGEVTLDVALRRASSVLVTLKTPEGQPAAGAQVVLYAEGQRCAWTPGGLDEDRNEPRLKADPQGQLPLNPDDSVVAVMVAHSSGFAVVAPAQLKSNRLLTLQPWSSVEGTAWSRGQPASGRTYMVSSLDPREPVTLVHGAFTATTDASGKFQFPRLPPGKYQIQHLTPTLVDDLKSVPGQSQIVEVAPGEHLSLDLGKTDRSVRLRLRFPVPDPHPVRFVSLLTPRPMPPAHIRTNARALQAWASRPEVYEVTVQGRVIGLAPSADGSWAATDVTPGPYLLHLGTHANSTRSPTRPEIYRAQILVPEGAPAEPVDLGEVAVAIPE